MDKRKHKLAKEDRTGLMIMIWAFPFGPRFPLIPLQALVTRPVSTAIANANK